jgi:hypothetical protein
MNRVLMLPLVASLVATGALSGCAYYGWPNRWPYSDTTPQWDALPNWSELRHWRVSYAGREPPRTPIEVIPDSPGDGYVWVSGHWRWENDDFQWVTGSWEKPPHKNEGWVPGRWGFDQYGWYYVNGHWQ